MINRANSRLNVIRILSRKFHSGRIDHLFLLKIYKGFVRPLFDYSHIPILSVSNSIQQQLQRFQNKCLRSCLRWPIYTRVSTLHQYASMPPLLTRLNTLSSKYFTTAMDHNPLIRDEYIVYNNDYLVRDGLLIERRRPYVTRFAKLSAR